MKPSNGGFIVIDDHDRKLLRAIQTNSDRTVQELADLIANEHLEWVERALKGTAAGSGFYPAVARATIDLVQAIRAK